MTIVYSLLLLLFSCCIFLLCISTQWLLSILVSIAGNKSGDVIMRSTSGGAVQIFQWSVCFSVESMVNIIKETFLFNDRSLKILPSPIIKETFLFNDRSLKILPSPIIKETFVLSHVMTLVMRLNCQIINSKDS